MKGHGRDERPKASCMCWFPAGAGGTRQLRRHKRALVAQPQDTVVATLGYDLRHESARSDGTSARLGAPRLVVHSHSTGRKDASGQLEASCSSQSSSGSLPDEQQSIHGRRTPDSTGGQHVATLNCEAAGLFGVADKPVQSSLAEFSCGQSHMRSSPAGDAEKSKDEDEDEDDYQITDIPLEIASWPSTMTCARVQSPSTLVLRPTHSGKMRNDFGGGCNENAGLDVRSVGRRGDQEKTDGKRNPSSSATRPSSPPVPPRALPCPVRSGSDVAHLKLERSPVKGFSGALPPVPLHCGRSDEGWSSVEDSGDDFDWVKGVFDDPTVVIAACITQGRLPEQGARRIAAQDLKDCLMSRKELEESHGFFTSSSNPFSSSPVPQERPSAKTSGTTMSAASTDKNASHNGSQSPAQQQPGHDSSVSAGSWRFSGDATRYRRLPADTQKKNAGDSLHHGNGRIQSADSSQGRPPSPCLRPGTLKNLTSAFEDHIRRLQELSKDTPRRPPVKASGRLGSLELSNSETLRKRIESDLQMLQLSDEDNSSGCSSPRDRKGDFNAGLLC